MQIANMFWVPYAMKLGSPVSVGRYIGEHRTSDCKHRYCPRPAWLPSCFHHGVLCSVDKAVLQGGSWCWASIVLLRCIASPVFNFLLGLDC